MRKIFLVILILIINSPPTCAEILELDDQKSKINYIFSYLSVPVKRNFLLADGFINIIEDDDKSLLIKGLDLNVKFTSKSSGFRRAIDFDKYPDFKFWTNLENPVQLSNKKFVTLEGYLSFHGVDQKIKIKLKSKVRKDDISLIGYFSIKMTDFGIPQPKIFFIVLDDVIKSKVELYTKLDKE